MMLRDIFSLQGIKLDVAARNKGEALKELVRLLKVRAPHIDEGQALAVLNERERLGSTAIGEGVAIPHGKLPGLSSVIGIFARSDEGIDFESYDHQTTHLFFALMAPEGQTGIGDHLKVLAKISRLLRNTQFRDGLYRADTAEKVYEILSRSDY